METVELGWDEFWAELFRVRHRQSIPSIEQYDQMIVDFIIEVLDLKTGNGILDIACGAGEHCIAFAKADLKPTGFDLSQRLIDVGVERAETESVNVKLYRADMREMQFSQNFHAVVILSHSFGFFNHEENSQVLEDSYKALLDGGHLLLDLMNPYNPPRFQRTWVKIDGGYLLNEPHTLDAPAGLLRGRPATFIDTEHNRIVLMNQDALLNNDIRMYTALEIRDMLRAAGFSKVEFYGQNKLPRMPYSAGSERMVVVAEK
ncbi:MAG: class I SAM-dependent methyltransferase [Candidatus Thorarchaeota archaeon]